MDTLIDMKSLVDVNNIGYPKIIDLFSGCGGLSYGFVREGFEIASGAELDEHAWQTASYNLHWKKGEDKEHLCRDVTSIQPEDLRIESNSPLITIGGPPCQAYSMIGRSKIKSLGEHRFGMNDERAFLYKEFLRLGVGLGSEAIIMENVPEAVNFLGMNVPEIVCEELKENGYNAVWTILNSANFGVPQTRERVFVIALRKDVGEINHLPIPTHRAPSDETLDKMNVKFKRFTEMEYFREPVIPNANLENWITVGDALSDLPVLFPSAESKYKLYKMGHRMSYQTPPQNNYQKIMRRTAGNKYMQSVDANSFRRTVRDFRIFEKMEPGDDYRRAHQIANELFEATWRTQDLIKENNAEKFEKLKKSFVPPYDLSKFHSKWKKLNPDRPSHTLVAHLSVDTYSHINPFEPRGISVREAARLQSFPDDFIFSVTMGSAFKQIGNAVPPLLAQGVANAVKRNLGQSSLEEK